MPVLGADDEHHEAELDVKKSISRKPIEQMIYISDILSLAVLSGTWPDY